MLASMKAQKPWHTLQHLNTIIFPLSREFVILIQDRKQSPVELFERASWIRKMVMFESYRNLSISQYVQMLYIVELVH